MGKNLVQPTTFRFKDKEFLRKIDIIAKNNCRNRNQQVEYILRAFVDEFEAENGEIIITPLDKPKGVTD